MNVTTTGDFGNAATVVGIETVNFILESVTALGTTADAIFEAAATNIWLLELLQWMLTKLVHRLHQVQ